jgi:phage-related protein
MATELGQAYVQIMPSAKGISANIEKELNGGTPGAKKSGGKMGSAMKVGLLAAVAGIGAVVGKAIFEGGELEQNLGGTEAVFGDFAKNIQDSATEAYKNMGLSASDYMATANKMGSLFQGSGMDQQKSLDLTSQAMQRAADVASVMGVDTSMAMESIAGAAKNNFTMMDNLGVAMNATSLQAYALEKGINFEWNTATQAEKSELAMKMFMDRTSQYAGNFARESEQTFSGSLGAMQSAWTNVLGQMATGQDATAAMSTLATSVVTFAQNLMPMITSVLSQLPTLIVTLLAESGPQLMETGAKAISELLNGLAGALPTLIPAAVEAIMVIVSTLIDNLPMIVDAAIALISSLAKGLIDSIPIIMEKIPVILDSIVTALLDLLPMIVQAGIDLFVSLVQALPEIIETIVSALPKIINSVIDAVIGSLPIIIAAGIDLFVALIGALPVIITTIVRALPKIIDGILGALISNLPLLIQAGVTLLTAIITNLPVIIMEIVRAMPQIIKSMVSALGQGISEFAKIGGNLLKGLWNGIKDAGTWLWNKISGFFGGVVDKIKNFFGIRSPSTMFEGFGENLDKGLANGITGNMKPISKAMDEVGALTTRSFESDIAMSASSSGFSGMQSAAMASQSSTAYNIYLNNMPASDSDKRKLAQYIEEERRRGLMARGAMA